MNGFRNELIDKIVGFYAHVTVDPYEKQIDSSKLNDERLKLISEDLYPERVAFYWFFGAFLFAVIKRLIFMVFGTKFRVPIKELSKYNEVMIISSIITVFGVAFWVIALRSVGPPVTSFLMKFQHIDLVNNIKSDQKNYNQTFQKHLP